MGSSLTKPSPERPVRPSGLAPSSPGPPAVHLLCPEALGAGGPVGSQHLDLVLELVSPAGRSPLLRPRPAPAVVLGPGLEPLVTDMLAWGLEGSG